MQKVSLLLSIKNLTWEHQVNYVTEATPLLTEKTDVTSLNQLAYAEAITVIKSMYGKWVYNQKAIHQKGKKRLDIQYELANKWSLCQYQQNITNEWSKTFNKNEKNYELNENKIPNFQWANKIHLTWNTQTTSVCPKQQTIQISKEVQTIPANQRIYKGTNVLTNYGRTESWSWTHQPSKM